MKWTYIEELRANFSMIGCDDGHVVCGIPNNNEPEDIEFQRKDAALICAVPDMVVTLRLILAFLAANKFEPEAQLIRETLKLAGYTATNLYGTPI